MGNPFLELYKMMGEATEIQPSFFIAKIKSPLPNLEVQLHDIVLDKDDLLIDKWLVDRNNSLFTKTIDHKHEIKEPIQDKLQVGDKVVLLRIDDKFIITNKVVAI